jgi:hypothetical protein
MQLPLHRADATAQSLSCFLLAQADIESEDSDRPLPRRQRIECVFQLDQVRGLPWLRLDLTLDHPKQPEPALAPCDPHRHAGGDPCRVRPSRLRFAQLGEGTVKLQQRFLRGVFGDR